MTQEAWWDALDVLEMHPLVVVQPRLDSPGGRLSQQPPIAVADALVRAGAPHIILVSESLRQQVGPPEPAFGALVRWEWYLRLIDGAGGRARLCRHEGWAIDHGVLSATPSENYQSHLAFKGVPDDLSKQLLADWDREFVIEHRHVVECHRALFQRYIGYVIPWTERRRELADRALRAQSRAAQATINQLRRELQAARAN